MVGVVKTSSDGALDVKSMKKIKFLFFSRLMQVSLKRVFESRAKLTAAGMPGFGVESKVGYGVMTTTNIQ